MGAKIIAQYAILGDYDFVNIFEAESNESYSSYFSTIWLKRYSEITTIAAITMQEYVRELEMARLLTSEFSSLLGFFRSWHFQIINP